MPGRNIGPRSKAGKSRQKPMRNGRSNGRTVFTPLVIEYVAFRMVCRERKHKIVASVCRILRRKKMNAGQMERMFREARQLLQTRLDQNPRHHKAISLATYNEAIRRAFKGEAELRDGLRAQERIDAILGHDAKFRDMQLGDAERARMWNEYIAETDALMGSIDDGIEPEEG